MLYPEGIPCAAGKSSRTANLAPQICCPYHRINPHQFHSPGSRPAVTMSRTTGGYSAPPGSDFCGYLMVGGRTRCRGRGMDTFSACGMGSCKRASSLSFSSDLICIHLLSSVHTRSHSSIPWITLVYVSLYVFVYKSRVVER